jgi:hypothetical protein
MAQTTRQRVVANSPRKRKHKRNAGRRKMSDKQLAIFGKPAARAAAKARLARKRSRPNSPKKRKTGSHSHRSKSSRRNGGKILGFTFGRNNPGGKGSMAKRKHHHKKAAGGRSRYKTNSPARHRRHHRTRRNQGGGMTGGFGGMVTNAVFVIVGALGSKLGAQMILGSNNTGIIGYVGNAAIGAALWLLTEKVMHNRAAASGVIAGTLVQLLLRAINDFTPFGQYTSQLGMGDYQVQSFVTPQVLVDPWNSAQIQIPNGWAPTMVAPAPAAAAAGGGGNGNTGVGDYAYGNNLYGGGRGTALY